MGSLSTADLLVVVIIADAAQNALSGEYRSITEGALLVGTSSVEHLSQVRRCFVEPDGRLSVLWHAGRPGPAPPERPARG